MTMDLLLKKLNLRSEQATIAVIRAPASFASMLMAMPELKTQTRLSQAANCEFMIFFVTRLTEIENVSKKVLCQLEGDPIVWFAYPKQSSKNFQCEFNRDNGWDSIGSAGFEPVRQVAIDDDWSALRFRKAAYIKNLTRSPQHAISNAGKQRAAKGKKT